MQQPVSFYEERFQGKFEPRLLAALAEVGHYSQLAAGDVLMTPGAYIRSVPIILAGTLKILRSDQEEKEILMYYLGSGESCAMSLSCCLNARRSEVTAVAEEPAELVLIPVEKIEEWITKYPSWRQFVFQTYQRRFDDLLTTIDGVAFQKMDERLWNYLRRKARLSTKKPDQPAIIEGTHEEIAQELGTSREVVSRLLKQLERMDRVRLARNRVELLEGEEL
ncbi:Crp/Fnr family transcriptional regulator [Rhabdobacter roseus]|uniref:CRP/FNR family transcriptional regulator n=1 Tax=Rhabdobacter roseus TaxID=1655419 RepID=A0A840TL90_9BACT|nr:Crp/Fnr family transcriptional regulator [Rhabdobacter roseus]MBB5281983.1 CRP/FNR family transcriptional regulator [Rhabdobacter roseus]